MSHFDYISKAAPGFNIVAHTADCPVAATKQEKVVAIQFHRKCFTQERLKMLPDFTKHLRL